MKAALFLALLGLILTTVFATITEISKAADAVEETERDYYYYKPCPCKCFIGYDEHKAYGACHSHRYRFHCVIKNCKKGYYYRGKACCDKSKPKPKPSPTPSKSPKPKIECPCKCVLERWAQHECHYKPYCEITKCTDELISHRPHGDRHGYENKYDRPGSKFQCCYKPYYHPHH